MSFVHSLRTAVAVVFCVATPSLAQEYSEPRVFFEAQWWDVVGHDLTDTRTSHAHIGVAAPERVSGDLVLDFILTTFHFSGSLRLLEFDLMRGGSDPSFHQDFYIRQEITDPHMFVTRAPRVVVDTTKLRADGWWHWAMTLSVRAPEQAGLPKREILMRLIGSVYVDNGKDVFTKVARPVFVAQGNVGGFPAGPIEIEGGYRSVGLRSLPDFATGCLPTEISWKPRSSGGAPIRAFATVNPDMHSHPPDLGDVFLDDPSAASRWREDYLPNSVSVGPARLFLRADDSPAVFAHTAAAVLVVKGQRC